MHRGLFADHRLPQSPRRHPHSSSIHRARLGNGLFFSRLSVSRIFSLGNKELYTSAATCPITTTWMRTRNHLQLLCDVAPPQQQLELRPPPATFQQRPNTTSTSFVSAAHRVTHSVYRSILIINNRSYLQPNIAYFRLDSKLPAPQIPFDPPTSDSKQPCFEGRVSCRPARQEPTPLTASRFVFCVSVIRHEPFN